MGVLGSRARYLKAKEFKKQCEGKLWFLFSTGDARWLTNSTLPEPRNEGYLQGQIPSIPEFLDEDNTFLGYPTEDICWSVNPDVRESFPLREGMVISKDGVQLEQWKYSYRVGNPFYPVCGLQGSEYYLPEHSFFNKRKYSQYLKGLLGIFRGYARFVKDVTDTWDKEGGEGHYDYVYGGRLWIYLNDDEADKYNCNSVLIESAVRYGQISNVDDDQLIIRQVCVLQSPSPVPGMRDFYTPTEGSSPNYTDRNSCANEVVNDSFTGKSVGDSQNSVNIEFLGVRDYITGFFNEDWAPYRDQDWVGWKKEGLLSIPTINLTPMSVLINDFMVSSPRRVNQQDRYGYVMGF